MSGDIKTRNQEKRKSEELTEMGFLVGPSNLVPQRNKSDSLKEHLWISLKISGGEKKLEPLYMCRLFYIIYQQK